MIWGAPIAKNVFKVIIVWWIKNIKGTKKVVSTLLILGSKAYFNSTKLKYISVMDTFVGKTDRKTYWTGLNQFNFPKNLNGNLTFAYYGQRTKEKKGDKEKTFT